MAFGILEDNRMERVPGTAYMEDATDVPSEYSSIPRELLKHASGKLSHVILVPQPTDSPNDPLNWSPWKKDTVLIIISLAAAVVGAFGPMLSPGFVTISAQLGISVNTLSQSTAWLILTLGLCLFLINPAAKIWGKRPIFIGAIVIMFFTSVWGGASKDYSSFLASRIVAGFGMAPYEILVQSSIGDMYFVHQRATRIAVWNVFLLCGISGGGLISGYIIEDIGWKWTFWICAIFFGILMFAILLFVPETSFTRLPLEQRFHRQTSNEKKTASGNSEKDTEKGSLEVEGRITSLGENDPPTPPPEETKQTYFQSLRIYTGRYTHAPFHKLLLRPIVMFFYPAVLWAFLVYGTTLSWIVVFSVVNASIFTLPPYNFSVSSTGLISLSPFIMTIIGEAIAGPLNDYLCLLLTRKNRGVYEPEFRLVLISVVAVIGCAGFYGFGKTVEAQTHWSGPVLCFGLANMAMAFASGSVFGYVIDSYEQLSEEAFVAINARNFLTFGLTYFVNDWLAKDGAFDVFAVLGSCFLGVCLTTIPLWIFGKRIRGAIARNERLNRFMMD